METDPALHRHHLRTYLDVLKLEYFSGLPNEDYEELAEEIVGILTENWNLSFVNLDVIEETRSTSELSRDETFLTSMFVHTFHDAANMLRRYTTDRHPSLRAQLEGIKWPAKKIVQCCRIAIREGLVVSFTPESKTPSG